MSEGHTEAIEALRKRAARGEFARSLREQDSRHRETLVIQQLAEHVRGEAWATVKAWIISLLDTALTGERASRERMCDAAADLVGDDLVKEKLRLRYWQGRVSAFQQVLESPAIAAAAYDTERAQAPPAA